MACCFKMICTMLLRADLFTVDLSVFYGEKSDKDEEKPASSFNHGINGLSNYFIAKPTAVNLEKLCPLIPLHYR